MPKKLRTPPQRRRQPKTEPKDKVQVQAQAQLPVAQVELRSTEGFSVPVRAEAPLGELAYYWNYVVQNRQRYSESSHKTLRKQSQVAFERMGVSINALEEFARRGVVEVRIPYQSEAIGWEARIMPWESLLSLGTKEWRKDRHLVVVRHLDDTRPRPPAPAPPISGTILFVASAPGRLDDAFSFENEYRLVSAAVRGDHEVDRLNSPTPTVLSDKIRTSKPAIIHLSGFDAHQGGTLIPGLEPKFDGFLLADEARQPDVIEAEQLGELLTANKVHCPHLIAFNCYYSAARLAPMSIVAGARLAIGFQDTFNDTVAEQFFAEFYTAWQADKGSEPLRTFANARLSIGTSSSAPQSGDVVLWGERSLISGVTGSFYSWLKPDSSTATAHTAVAAPTTPPPPLEIFVSTKVRDRLNYSLLHNNAGPFSIFKILKSRLDVNPDVDIRVELYVGEAAFPYRAVCSLKELQTDYSEQIRVPLLANVLRGRRESIQTSLFIEVKHDERVIHRTTERVTLLPADEWTDDPLEWQWLPSFVLPRDGAITTILTHGERYLRALADNSAAGFDGYQRLLADGSNPEVVDLQVRAIWAALLYGTPLTYINPPPTYTQNAQRLRTPSVILEEGRGTCIDLALLFAACLEYVGILPVIFLIQGHCFPGYWRRPTDQAKLGTFGNLKLPSASTTDALQTIAPQTAPAKSWVFAGEQAFREIVNAVNAGGLVPVETVQLSQRGAFSQALELGIKNLATPWNFDALIDIQIARDGGVTPLPLFQNQF
jgi:hypothetical protein